ncbi:MAG: 6-phosphogluconolactonase [Rhodospirillaceae bacterium]|nr:6-phosphogluconolactonase [Rhodospirillaceae bacterium]
MPKAMQLTVFPDAPALGRAAAEWLIERLERADGEVAVALSGGSTPRHLYRHLAQPDLRDRLPWQRLHWFWGDERCVPPDDPRSNFGVFRSLLLAGAPAPAANVHPVPTLGCSPHEAAGQYAAELQRFYRRARSAADACLFDVVVLGLGEDGHTASLFPGSSALGERDSWVVAVTATGGEPRITLTYPALESCRHCLFLVSGRAKRGILDAVVRGEDCPAARLRTRGACAWFVDSAAAPPAGAP